MNLETLFIFLICVSNLSAQSKEKDHTKSKDAVNGSCRASEFLCPDNSKCIPGKWLCDGDSDCPKGEDEDNSVCAQRTCDSEEWRCEVGQQCLPVAWVCDGTPDCIDGSDERVCTKTCSDQEFKCDNELCINPVWKCDGEDDCGDMSDENGCNSTSTTCDVNDFVCRDGACLSMLRVCDGDADCAQGEDEISCKETKSPIIKEVCADDEFKCRDQHYCIQQGWVCDGDSDCPDGSDESVEECGSRRECSNHEFECENGECIPGHLQCSGVSDCKDGSDELHCGNAVETCSKAREFNCGGGCIPVEKACDGENDCGNWEDEPDTCNKNECHTDNGGCQQLCVDTPTSYHCTCQSGYRLLNSTHCQDVNECSVAGSCSQICINLPGTFKCDCVEGYRKESHDHTRCKAAEGHLSLLFTHKTDIRKLSLERNAMTSIVNETRSACALDYVFRTGMIFWTDVMEETMFTAPIDEGWRQQSVMKNSVITSDGLAVDWVYSHIYWTDSRTNTISMSDYQGRLVTTLLTDQMEEPRSIALHPKLGWMVWSDWGKVPRIERAGMDGSHRQTIKDKSLHWPNGITIDLVMDRIYWIDAKLHMIGSSNLDGSASRLVLFSTKVLGHPFSITVFEDKVYWSDWNTKAIYQANKFDGSNVTALTSSNVEKIPMTIHMYHPMRQPELPNYCLPYNGDCSHMCVPAPRLTDHSARTSCVCPNGLVLEEGGRNCVPDPSYQVEELRQEKEKDLANLVVPETSVGGHVSGMVIGTAAAAMVLCMVLSVYMYRRRHLKRSIPINFDNPVYRRGAEINKSSESQERNCSIIRENEYIDIAICETEGLIIGGPWINLS